MPFTWTRHISQGPNIREFTTTDEAHWWSRKGFFLRNRITRESPVRSKLALLYRDFKKFIFGNSAEMINHTSSATGATKLHLPRKAKIKLVRTHGPVVLYFYLELNQSNFKSEGLPNSVWSSFLLRSLISHLPATVARDHECTRRTPTSAQDLMKLPAHRTTTLPPKQLPNYITRG